MFSESLKSEIPSICSFFEAALLRNKLFHSYLFCGSDEEIKDKFAKELIQLLNCTNRANAEPACGHCNNCSWIQENTHPEVPIIIEPDLEKSKKGVILVGQVQKLLSKLQYKTQFYRVIIIKTAEMEFLPSESANSLLKTIEEPSPNTLFLMYARDKEMVMPTIYSRSQPISFPGKIITKEINSVVAGIADSLFYNNSQINFFEAGKLASELSAEIAANKDLNSTETLNGALDDLAQICLNTIQSKKFSIDESERLWLKRIELIGKAQSKLRSFCSAQPVLENLFSELPSITN